MEKGKFKALVLDSGAFISFASITGVAEVIAFLRIWWNRNIIQSRKWWMRWEISRQEEHSSVFLLRSKFVIPVPKQLQLVSILDVTNYVVEKFSKSTGDFTRLSQTDLLLIALEYDLQKEICGIETINSTPLLEVRDHFLSSDYY